MGNKIYASRESAVSRRELDHLALARAMAGECVVLLENDGTLPLSSGGRIALYGSGARRTVRGGTGSGDVNTRSDVNIEQGLENAGFSVTTGAWLDRQDAAWEKAKTDHDAWIADEARRLGLPPFAVSFSHPFQVIAPVSVTQEDIRGSDTDTAVYVISRTAGEGADRWDRRGDYLLYEEEKEQLMLLAGAYARLIVVLNVGGVIDMSEILAVKGVGAVVLLGQLGCVGGDVLADVLTGKVNPSGKLADTWACRYSDYPSPDFSHNNGNLDDEYYTEGIYVGYRYFDTFGVAPVYPFGFGRSYTSFEISPEGAELTGDTVTVRAGVKNTGGRPGREVVQLYFSAPRGELDKPAQELLCFAKTGELAPGESETLVLSFRAGQMASYSESRAAWLLEAGDYLLRLGSSSRDTAAAAVVRVRQGVETEKLRNLFGAADGVKEIEPPVPAAPQGFDAPVLFLLPWDIPTREAAYTGERTPCVTEKKEAVTAGDILSGRASAEELAAQLTVEELAELCVGTARENGAVVSSASRTVPGAAGDTSASLLSSRGIVNIIMADGPAGLRLQPVFKTDKEGNLLPGGGILGEIREPFDPRYTEENSDTYYQYCTAIPIGWSLAMSWNMSMLEAVGAMVGTEMEQFGVDLWLAPALNIHRNPLCGRNFEYYSEDPVLSGKAAAAITAGVQSRPGKGVTIKHFALNNQEDNRYFTSAHVSERAAREIYLRGFRIAVEEARPMAIMTSYNLLNGVHTANCRDLIQAAARDEWGFDGLVMTDWYTSVDNPVLTGGGEKKYPISASTGCIFAGNDIQMPGCEKNAEDIVRAVKSGEELDGFRITLADLQFCAANVIRAALRVSAGKEKG